MAKKSQALVPGTRVQWTRFQETYQFGNPTVETGVLLDWEDPQVWGASDPAAVREHVAACRAKGTLVDFVPVRWDVNGLIRSAPRDELQTEGSALPAKKRAKPPEEKGLFDGLTEDDPTPAVAPAAALAVPAAIPPNPRRGAGLGKQRSAKESKRFSHGK